MSPQKITSTIEMNLLDVSTPGGKIGLNRLEISRKHLGKNITTTQVKDRLLYSHGVRK